MADARAAGFLSSWTSSMPELWEGWVAPIDHVAWDHLLKTYLRTDDTGLTRFAYADVTEEDRKALKKYVSTLSKIEITDRARDVQLAY